MRVDQNNVQSKIMLKVLNERRDQLSWEHFCYVNRDLYHKYLHEFSIERVELSDSIARWAKEDFNIDLSMSSYKDIRVVKALITDKYKSIYPHIFTPTYTDHQGWTRVWVTTHMERDLKGLHK